MTQELPEPGQRVPGPEADEQPVPGAAAGTSARAVRGRAALTVIGAALVVFALTSPTWFSARVPGAVQGEVDVAVSGAAAVPALGGLALVLLAAGAALGLVGRAGRRVVGGLLVVGGAVGAALVVQAMASPGEALRDAVASSTGVGAVPTDVVASPLPALTLAFAVLVVALGVRHAVGRGRWPTPGARHDRAAESSQAATDGETLHDPARAWDALSDGADPS